jgi:hypothetical protein
MTKGLAFLLLGTLAACAEPKPSSTTGGTTSASSAGNTSGGASSGGSGGVQAGAPCATDPQCASGHCLGGYCCATGCKVDDIACKPTACAHGSGVCAYPSSSISCGGGCNENVYTPPSSCDGAGTCTGAKDCGTFVCQAATGCPVHCSDDSVCATDTHCFQRVCCAAIATKAKLYVDGATGADIGCCGATAATACQTIGAAMKEIEASKATGATILATVNGTTGNWTAPETWPVTLHLGVTLHAPGVYFYVPDNGSNFLDAFAVAPFDASDSLPVTIEGDAATYAAFIGFAADATQYGGTKNGVSVTGLTVRLGSVWLNGAGNGVEVADRGNLEIDGFVNIGNYTGPSGGAPVPGNTGISCAGSSAANVATVTDPGGRAGDLIIQGQSQAGISAGSYCTINLDHAPTFGVFDGGCASSKPDHFGLVAFGDPGQVTLTGPTFQCMLDDGVQLSSGNPVVTLNNPIIKNSGCGGLTVLAGNLYSNNGQITHNHWGVVMQTGGHVFLNGGGTGGVSGGNAITCNTQAEPGDCATGGYPGVDVENDSTDALNADNCTFDHSPPSELSCTDSTFTACTCTSAPATLCPTAATNYDGVDVAITSATGTVSVNGSQASAAGCP